MLLGHELLLSESPCSCYDIRILDNTENAAMSAVKTQVMNLVQDLPEDVTLDDIMAEIYFKAQVDAGLKELDEGRGIPHQEVEKRMSKWLAE